MRRVSAAFPRVSPPSFLVIAFCHSTTILLVYLLLAFSSFVSSSVPFSPRSLHFAARPRSFLLLLEPSLASSSNLAGPRSCFPLLFSCYFLGPCPHRLPVPLPPAGVFCSLPTFFLFYFRPAPPALPAFYFLACPSDFPLAVRLVSPIAELSRKDRFSRRDIKASRGRKD